MSTDGTAVVVGAGIGGLAAALALRRAGVRVTVLERRDEPAPVGTALGIHPRGQLALERLGVGEGLARESVPYRSAQIRRPDGRVLAELPLRRIERRAGRPELLIPRPALLRLLLEAVRGTEGIVLKTGEPVRPDELDGLRAEFGLVVGADGLHSAVRRGLLGDGYAVRRAGTTVWIGVTGFEAGAYGETWGSGRFFGMTPHSPGRTNWYATMDRADTLEEARACFAGWHEPVRRLMEEADPETVIRYEMRYLAPRLPSFTGDRTALLGDAAHAMVPNLGQGAVTAILDADALGAAVARRSGDLAGALRTYDAERRRPSQRIAAGALLLHRVMSTRRTGLRNAVVRMLPG